MNPSYRVAMLAYPAEYRQEHGPELVTTANELSPGGWSLRQARSLTIEGLRPRARMAAGPTGRQTWFDGAALALALWYLLGTTGNLAYLLGARGDITSVSPSPGVSAVVGLSAVAALTVTARWPTAAALTALSGIQVLRLVLDDPNMPAELWATTEAAASPVPNCPRTTQPAHSISPVGRLPATTRRGAVCGA